MQVRVGAIKMATKTEWNPSMNGIKLKRQARKSLGVYKSLIVEFLISQRQGESSSMFFEGLWQACEWKKSSKQEEKCEFYEMDDGDDDIDFSRSAFGGPRINVHDDFKKTVHSLDVL